MDAPRLNPWQIHPALTRDRLIVMGRLMWDARASAATDAKWGIGNRLWGIGCTAFERTLHAVMRAAFDVHGDWLSLQNKSKHFVFRIGGVPVRFSKKRIEAIQSLMPLRVMRKRMTKNNERSSAPSI